MIEGSVKLLYENFIRSYIPRKLATLNGVAVRYPRLFDRRDDWPDWEKSLCGGIRDVVDDGNRVLVIGGGHGVSTVHAAQAAGQDGSVIAYEAVGELVALISDTVERNITPAEVEIKHAAVGDVSDWSAATHGRADSETVRPVDLPASDVAVLDCEGAEQEILPELLGRIDRIVVETHGFLGSTTEDIRSALEDARYEVSVQGAEDVEKDVYILSAVSRLDRCDGGKEEIARNDL
jgi:hypothetical protein